MKYSAIEFPIVFQVCDDASNFTVPKPHNSFSFQVIPLVAPIAYLLGRFIKIEK